MLPIVREIADRTGAGDIDLLWNDALLSMPAVKSGKARILATTGTTRSPYAPEAPPLSPPESTTSTPSAPASRLATYSITNRDEPRARSSIMPSWYSSSMFMRMWNTPKWMKPAVTRRYHWCEPPKVPSLYITPERSRSRPTPSSACAA